MDQTADSTTEQEPLSEEKTYVSPRGKNYIGQGPPRDVLIASHNAHHDEVVRPIPLKFHLVVNSVDLPRMAGYRRNNGDLIDATLIGCVNMIEWVRGTGEPIAGPNATQDRRTECLVRLIDVRVPANWRKGPSSKSGMSDACSLDTVLIQYDTKSKQGRVIGCTML